MRISDAVSKRNVEHVKHVIQVAQFTIVCVCACVRARTCTRAA